MEAALSTSRTINSWWSLVPGKGIIWKSCENEDTLNSLCFLLYAIFFYSVTNVFIALHSRHFSIHDIAPFSLFTLAYAIFKTCLQVHVRTSIASVIWGKWKNIVKLCLHWKLTLRQALGCVKLILFNIELEGVKKKTHSSTSLASLLEYAIQGLI